MNIFSRVLLKIQNTYRKKYFKSKMKKFGNNSYIIKPLLIYGYEDISIGDNVMISHSAWLGTMRINNKPCKLEIGSGCNIGHYNHICATGEVIFEEEVLTADKVYISDHLHGYEDISISILKQPIVQKGFVRIGKGSWIGENVCIIGCSIGKQCVIGANAVVTKNIPDYCVAAGNPAKIIKRYCFETLSWKKTSYDGEFIS